jgi:sulfide dehydrogenase [flavocytochrome c] flavoprotein subunit
MQRFSRRRFLELLGRGGALSALHAVLPPLARAADAPGKAARARVLIVGGGFGGATCAKYLRRFAPDIHVTLIERDTRFVTCPFSNTVLAGINDMDYISHDYGRLRKNYGIELVHDTVTEIDPVARRLTLASGDRHSYDALVVSPGIDFRWDAVPGYDEQVAETIPHAWKAGAQTLTLRHQLQAMPDGGVVILAPPADPYRCPPGPYERASLVANYLKTAKPRSKLLILDAKDKFSKQPLFVQGWAALYPGMIEWIGGSDWGGIGRLDAATHTLYSAFDVAHKADVINLIPPQKAGAIAHATGLVNADGWCPVDQRSFESKLHKDVYIIGDASVAGQMPKSGFAANSQGKVCAAALTAKFHAVSMPEPSYVNTCYSLVAPDYGISVAGVYRLVDGEIKSVEKSGGVSPADADRAFRENEARYAAGWYQSIVSDSFG